MSSMGVLPILVVTGGRFFCHKERPFVSNDKEALWAHAYDCNSITLQKIHP